MKNQELREVLQKIAALASSAGIDRPRYSSTIRGVSTVMAPIFCMPKELPRHLLVPAAKIAVEINPLNSPFKRHLSGLSGISLGQLELTPEQIAVLTEKRWQREGVNLTVGFLDNPSAELRARILAHMNAWAKTANVNFVETKTDPHVRIARRFGDGYWSYVGTDILSVPAGQPTINLDSFTENTSEEEFTRVVRHETGHTMGFPHEHMRRELVEKIDPVKAIQYFGQTQGWDAEMVRQQVLTPIEESSLLGTQKVDTQSIMCYQIPGTITKDGQPIIGGLDIDPSDYEFVGTIYPKKNGVSPNQFALTDPQRDVILRISEEVHNARWSRALRSGQSGFGRATKPPGRAYDAALTQWHSVLRTVLGDQAPPKPPDPPPPPPPPPLPTQLGPFDTGPIVFDGGVPVGGWSQVTLFQNGAYNFTGHYHVSGAPSYDTQFAWAIVGATGVLYTFSHSGHVAGTFESGSRDDDWNIQGTNPALAAGWADLTRQWTWHWKAGVNWDVAALIDTIKQAIAAAQQIIQVIQLVV